MMQCPTCGSRTFEIGMTVSTLVTVECDEGGDYTEVHEDRQDCHWHTITCTECGTETDQEDAEEAFAAAQEAPDGND